jgi:hypothetical protein
MPFANIEIDSKLWGQLEEIGQQTGQHPVQVALGILRAGVEAKTSLLVEEAEHEAFRLEAELTAVKAHLAALNGSPNAPVSPVALVTAEVGPHGLLYHTESLRQAVREVLNTDRHRTWSTGEVTDMLKAQSPVLPEEGDRFYKQVNNALRHLCTINQASNPVRGQYTWRRSSSRA